MPSALAAARPHKRHGSSRAARLEKKLDELVSVLRSQGTAQSDAPDEILDNFSEYSEDEVLSGTSAAASGAALLTPAASDSLGGSSTVLSAVSTSAVNVSTTDEPSLTEAEESLKRFREETLRRAVLGAFAVTSMISYVFKRAEGLPWSPYLNEHLTHLYQESTVIQDKVLVSQVRMQLIVDQIRQAPWQSTGSDPAPSYLSALRAQLHEITKKETMNVVIGSNTMISELLHFTGLLIYESAISKPHLPWNEPDYERFEIYQGCLNSIRAWLDTFFSTPINLYRIYRITTLEDPVWDRDAVRKAVDLIPTCDKIIGIFEYLKTAPALISSGCGDDEAYTWGTEVLQKMRRTWQADISKLDAASRTSQNMTVVDGTQAMNFWGDPWWLDGMSTSWD
ncbi:Uu.00g030820.m01.CDS01 [Anthostomella pinea]|uniref:Uu.00g030820.m01.CDS01 n=1 Tax=Anthostomella pinea TaxID=933095 RepID=A0AAI8V884_9PEZI|nr:Uu.00g030820.m01.CDS01 [Anthostomella pinea]